jgi:Zn-dependent protease with chaperone function
MEVPVKRIFRICLVLLLSELLVMLPLVGDAQQLEKRATTPPKLPQTNCTTLPCYVRLPYLTLFEISPELEFGQNEIEAERKALEQARTFCVAQFKQKAKQAGDEVNQGEKKLKEVSEKISDTERHTMHCNIQDARARQQEAQVLSSQAIPIAYSNELAKLKLIQQWPGDLKVIKQEIADGSYLKRRWGNVKDIGFRQIMPGQEKDIKAGQQAIRQLKQEGMMPHELEDKAITDYVDSVAQRVAQHSDLHIPLHVTVLDSKEINAFALPGGYMFVERGLLDAADDEAELAGVMGHEIGHDVARHSHQLMTKATIASIFYNAAEIAAMVLTGGVASIGMYYALEYGFYGLGMVLDLKLLGVSRDFELQADQLGIQYAWNSGYDPTGFIRFFDKMATKEGYINGMSWFRDHPPFYERMVDAEREIMFLPKKPDLVVQTSAFEQMKKELEALEKKNVSNGTYKPSLLMPEPGCPEPHKVGYKPGEPIEAICAQPGAAEKAN